MTVSLVAGGKVYTLGTMGDLLCLEADTGKVVWSKNHIKDYQAPLPVWGWAAHLLLVDDKLISLVGGEGQAVVAWDAVTGKERWKALSTKEVGYAPPSVLTLGGKQQVCVLLSESVNGLDLDGKTLWTQKYPVQGDPKRPAVSIAMPRQEGDLLFVSSFYHGALMLNLKDNKPTVVWKSKRENPERADSLHACMSTPIVKDGYLYGVGGYGELRCLKLDTGEEQWSTHDATEGKAMFLATAFLTPQGERCWILNDRGELLLTKLTPEKFEILDRAKAIEPSQEDRNGRQVVWCHPAYARHCLFVRNDKEIVCVSLEK